MKKLATSLAMAVVLSAGAAFADTIENGYGNTFVVTSAQGEARYHFDAGGAYAMHAGENHVTGTYTVADGQLCLTPAGGERACTPYDGDKNVGDTWTQAGADGSEITVSLQAGR